jgi:hypothetical protein
MCGDFYLHNLTGGISSTEQRHKQVDFILMRSGIDYLLEVMELL